MTTATVERTQERIQLEFVWDFHATRGHKEDYPKCALHIQNGVVEFGRRWGEHYNPMGSLLRDWVSKTFKDEIPKLIGLCKRITADGQITEMIDPFEASEDVLNALGYSLERFGTQGTVLMFAVKNDTTHVPAI